MLPSTTYYQNSSNHKKTPFADELAFVYALLNTGNRCCSISRMFGYSFSLGYYKWLHFSSCSIKLLALLSPRHWNCDQTLHLLFGNVNLPTVASTSYLDMIFNEKLHWRSHIKNFKNQCNQILNLICKLAHSTYSADTTWLIHLYKAVIGSKFDYELFTSRPKLWKPSKSLLFTLH